MDITAMPLIYVDVETTGFDPNKCRMIEVAAIRKERGQETDRVVTLLELQEELPEVITKITGITADQLKDSPSFQSQAVDLLSIFRGGVFVAHNAKFDYSFFKAEFARLEMEFSMPALCTVELARYFYPNLPNHKLQTLIDQFKFGFEERHRAYDDAAVLIQFMNKLREDFGIGVVKAAADLLHFPAPPLPAKSDFSSEVEIAPYSPVSQARAA